MMNFENQVIDLPNISFPNRKFKMKKQIGAESQGIVYQAQPFDWNIVHDVAIKISFQLGEREYKLIDDLIVYQQQCDQNEESKSQIQKIFEKCQYQNHVLLIMELGQNDFYNFKKMKDGQLSLLEKIKIMKQLARLIKYLHDRNILHNDITPEQYVQVGEEFKLIGFGQIQKNSLYLKSINQGSPSIFVPQIQKDIYLLGVTFMEFLQEQEIQQNMSSSNFIIKPLNNDPKIEAKIKTLIQNMTNQTSQFKTNINDVLFNLVDIANQIQNPFKKLYFQQNASQMSDQDKNLQQQKNFFKIPNSISQISTTQASQIPQIDLGYLKQQYVQIHNQLNQIQESVSQNTQQIQSIQQTISNQQKISEKTIQEFQTLFQCFLSQFSQAMNQNSQKNQDHQPSNLNNQLDNLKEFFSQQINKKFNETIDQQKLLLSNVERSFLSQPIISQYSLTNLQKQNDLQMQNSENYFLKIKEQNENLKNIKKKQDELNQLMLHISLQINNLNKNDTDQTQIKEQEMEQFEIFKPTFYSKKQKNAISSDSLEQQQGLQKTNNLTYSILH